MHKQCLSVYSSQSISPCLESTFASFTVSSTRSKLRCNNTTVGRILPLMTLHWSNLHIPGSLLLFPWSNLSLLQWEPSVDIPRVLSKQLSQQRPSLRSACCEGGEDGENGEGWDWRDPHPCRGASPLGFWVTPGWIWVWVFLKKQNGIKISPQSFYFSSNSVLPPFIPSA